ncbi:MAG TPA: hypothetical protein VN445_08200 [Rectinemataceae bacterium]|nr:hypothetical protein [Rectinemataceae bacterium]
MNQDQVKSILLEVEECPTPFTLAFTGKANKKVNGLYKPETAEIVLHNKNFESDNQLLYTALHEYAHHLHHARRGGLQQSRPHTQEFWAIFHGLVQKAQEKGFYENIFETVPEFVELTKTIKENCILANGEIMLEFGRLLAQASQLCRVHRARFEDYIERVLGVPRATATAAVAAQQIGLDPGMGWDSLRFVSGIHDPDERTKAIEALSAGASPTSVKGFLKSAEDAEDPADRLFKEKARIEKTIRSLSERLEEIEKKLSEI